MELKSSILIDLVGHARCALKKVTSFWRNYTLYITDSLIQLLVFTSYTIKTKSFFFSFSFLFLLGIPMSINYKINSLSVPEDSECNKRKEIIYLKPEVGRRGSLYTYKVI